MGLHRLEPFPAVDLKIHTVANRLFCAKLESLCPGAESFLCSYCDAQVLRAVNPRQIQGLAFECDDCGGHGVFPPEHDFYPHSERSEPPPQPMAAGSRVEPAELRSELTNALAWLHSIGINAEQGRVAAYLRGVPSSGPMDDIAFAESGEIIEIYSTLRDTPHTDYFRERFKRMADGPISMVDEKPGASSNAARNFAFELVIAARFVASGIELDTTLGADVAVRFDRRRIALHCKRPMSDAKVETALRKARAQLEENYKASEASTIGLIVVDLTKVGAFDRNHATGSYEEIYRRHMAYMDAFLERRSRQLRELCGGTKTVGLVQRVQQTVFHGNSRMQVANWHWKVFDWAHARNEQSIHALALRFRDCSLAQHQAKETHVIFGAGGKADTPL